MTIAAVNNNVDTANKTLTVSGAATNSVGVTNPGNLTLTIADDDSTPTVTLVLTPASISENGNTAVTATLNHPSGTATTLTITATPVLPAVAGDFSLSSNTLTIAAGSTSSSGNVRISAVDNSVNNLAKSISISATAANSHGITQPSTLTLTITDNDVPTLSISSPSVTESATGSTTTMTFTVSLNPASLAQVTVDYADAGTGSATAGTDYATLTGGTLTFAVGETSKSFDVTVNGDELSEGPETVIVSLSNASPSSALSSTTVTGTGTIVDDDRVLSSNANLRSLTISEGELSPEFASGVSNYTVVVAANVESLTVTPTVRDSLARGVTVNGNSVSSGSVSNPISLTVGENAVSIVVTAENNTQKTYTIAITRSASIVTLVLTPASISEEDGSTTVTATLDHPSTSATTLTIVATPVAPAVAGDFSLGENTTLTIVAGSTSSTGEVTISAVDNSVDNLAKSISVSAVATNSVGITQPSALILTITDDEVPTLSIDSPRVIEGAMGSTAAMTFTVSLSLASAVQVTVDYADAGTGTATSGTDYATITGGTLTFAVGETSATFEVTVTGDNDLEEAETVVVSLGNASPPSVLSSSPLAGTGIIVDDDRELSSNADLSSLTISEGVLSPEFASDVTSYTVVVAGNVESLTVTSTLSDTSARGLTVNGNSVTSGSASAPISLATGENTVSIVVTAENGTQKTYAITITQTEETVADRIEELDTEIVTEVAREIAATTIETITGRISGVIGGVPATGTTLPPPSPTGGLTSSAILPILTTLAQKEEDLNKGTISIEEALDGASFAYSPDAGILSATDAESGLAQGSIAVWGSADYQKLSGGSNGPVNWNGSLFSVYTGTDTMIEPGLLVGIAAGVSKGNFGYSGGIMNSSGTIRTRMTALYPYVGWAVSDAMSLWATVGYGKGKIEYNDSLGNYLSDTAMTQLSAGGRYRLNSEQWAIADNEISIDLKGEVWGTRSTINGNASRVAGRNISTSGLRVALEGFTEYTLESGVILTPSGEAGVRVDSGDGDNGVGMEVGGSLKFDNQELGLTVDTNVRALLTHDSGKKEWGAGVVVRRTPVSDKIGLTYEVSVLHGEAESSINSLWEENAANRSVDASKPVTSFDTEIGYSMYENSGVVTPYIGLNMKDTASRSYRLGGRYENESSMDYELEFEQRHSSGKSPDNRILLQGKFDW